LPITKKYEFVNENDEDNRKNDDNDKYNKNIIQSDNENEKIITKITMFRNLNHRCNIVQCPIYINETELRRYES